METSPLRNRRSRPACYLNIEFVTGTLKEYYEIVDEARPLSGFVPTHADSRNAFIIMKLSKLPSFRVIRQSTFEKTKL